MENTRLLLKWASLALDGNTGPPVRTIVSFELLLLNALTTFMLRAS